MRQRILGTFVALLLAALLLAQVAARASTPTTVVPLPATGAWTDLGTGAVAIQATNSAAVVVQSDTQPVAGAAGVVLFPAGGGYALGGALASFMPPATAHLWGRSLLANQASSLVVTPNAAAAAAGPSSAAIIAPLGANTRAQSLSITLATDFLGRATMAGSLPVTLASDQPAIPVADAAAEAALGAQGYTAAAVTGGSAGAGSAIAQLKAQVGQLAALLAQLKTTLAVSGTVTAQQPAATTYAVSWSGQAVGITGTVQLGAGSAAIGAVSVSNFPATQAISGTVTANQGGAPWAVSWTGQAVGITGTVQLGAGSAAIGAVSISNFPATQTVSATALPLPAGAATVAAQNSTAAGTSSTNAQGVQGVTGGVPVPTTDSNTSQTTATSGSSSTKAQSVQAPSGAALGLDSSLQSIKTTLGSPLQSGGIVNAYLYNGTNNQAISNTNPLPVAASEADGADVTLGSKADAASAAVGSTGIAILRQLHADAIAATPAGTNIVGKVGIDQTTPGTTNGVQVNAALPTGSNVIGQTQGLGYNDNASVPQLATGYNAVRIDNRGQYKISETGSADASVGITPAITQSGTSLVGKASQGNLYGGYAVLGAAAGAQTYLVAINATAAPATGTAITPLDVAVFPSNAIGAQASLSYGAGPPNAYSTGIVFLITTSLTTYTAGANSLIQARVR